MSTVEEIKQKLEESRRETKSPEAMRYEFVGNLCQYNSALTDLNDKQIHVICAFTALNSYMLANGQEGLPVIMNMFNEFKLNRISLDRKSRSELERILRPGTIVKNYGASSLSTGEPQEKQGFFSKIFGGKKHDQ